MIVMSMSCASDPLKVCTGATLGAPSSRDLESIKRMTDALQGLETAIQHLRIASACAGSATTFHTSAIVMLFRRAHDDGDNQHDLDLHDLGDLDITPARSAATSASIV